MVPVIVVAALIWNCEYISMAFRPADRTAFARYYDSLVSYLDTVQRPFRIEVVPTHTFAHADTLALRIGGIARGWETQLDRELNPEFYTGRLDDETYHRWLLENAVLHRRFAARAIARHVGGRGGCDPPQTELPTRGVRRTRTGMCTRSPMPRRSSTMAPPSSMFSLTNSPLTRVAPAGRP